MDAAAITRMRWRLRGAWLWPSFVVLVLADGAIQSWRPLLSDHGSAVGGLLQGSILSLIAIAVFSPRARAGRFDRSAETCPRSWPVTTRAPRSAY